MLVGSRTSALAPPLRQMPRNYAARLHDHRCPLHRREALADAEHARPHRLGRADINHQQVVFFMVQDAVDKMDQFGVAHAREAALKHGQLQPFAIAFHHLEQAAPALVIGDVVGDDVEMFGSSTLSYGNFPG